MKERGKQLFGVVSWLDGDERTLLTWAMGGGTCLIDGKEIRLVCFADTAAGIVKTYDVMGDGESHFARGYTPADFPGREVECVQDDVLTETQRGKVELFACPGAELPA